LTKHIYHYNVHSEQRYFLGDHRELYDLILINGNIVSHTPSGVASFLATANKPFYIDPQTHIFQHSTIHLKDNASDSRRGEPPDYQFKPSIIRLARERLGAPFSNVIERDRPLAPSDFETSRGDIDLSIISAVCNNVVSFQKETMLNSLDDEARDLMSNNPAFLPEFIVAPYFFLSRIRFRKWFEITLACYERTKEIEASIPVFLALVTSKDALRSSKQEIAQRLSEMHPDGIILWIDDQVEETMPVSELESFIGLLRELEEATDTIFNSHGGYFSLLLSHSESGNLLDGVGHCINYGESRPVVPVGGGIPMARFYFPSIHSRIRFGDALGIARAMNWLTSVGTYRSKICSCLQCSELLDAKQSADEAFFEYGRSSPITFTRRTGSIVSLEYPTKEARQAAARHYLYNKAKEFGDIHNRPLRELKNDLTSAFNELSPHTGEDLIAHLNKWANALSWI
jgi:hypothetical protein